MLDESLHSFHSSHTTYILVIIHPQKYPLWCFGYSTKINWNMNLNEQNHPIDEWKKYAKEENAWGQVTKIFHECHKFLYSCFSVFNIWNILFPKICLILPESVGTDWCLQSSLPLSEELRRLPLDEQM